MPARTAFSTSCGFESQVPSPICGMVFPVDRAKTFPNDMPVAGIVFFYITSGDARMRDLLSYPRSFITLYDAGNRYRAVRRAVDLHLFVRP
jgi:hypothetical protein